MIQIAIIETEDQLKPVLAFCYEILGQHYRDYEQYIYEAWQNRMGVFSPILSYAHADNTVVAAVLGRPENEDSLIMGFTACHEDYRKKGITSRLVAQRAVRLNSQAYGDRVINLIDDYIAENKISQGGLKEMLRTREIICAYFYENNSDYIQCAIDNMMVFAFKERGAART